MTTGTFMTETKYHRLIYLTERTRVELDCPDEKIRDNLYGLHKFPLQCDISTDHVSWPAQQSVKIEIQNLIPDIAHPDITKIPIINVNESDKVSDSIRTLISELPDKDQVFAGTGTILLDCCLRGFIGYGNDKFNYHRNHDNNNEIIP